MSTKYDKLTVLILTLVYQGYYIHEIALAIMDTYCLDEDLYTLIEEGVHRCLRIFNENKTDKPTLVDVSTNVKLKFPHGKESK